MSDDGYDKYDGFWKFKERVEALERLALLHERLRAGKAPEAPLRTKIRHELAVMARIHYPPALTTAGRMSTAQPGSNPLRETEAGAPIDQVLRELEGFKELLAGFRAKHGRDAVRRLPQGLVLDMLDAGMEPSSGAVQALRDYSYAHSVSTEPVQEAETWVCGGPTCSATNLRRFLHCEQCGRIRAPSTETDY